MVSVDNVYQKVLALANKEQRGYITPQEFNLFADQAQMEIFEQYFYDVEQFERRVGDDTAELTKRKIELFKSNTFIIGNISGSYAPLPTDTYLVESAFLNRENGKQVTAEKMDRDSQHNIHAAISASPLLNPNESRPIYWIKENGIKFVPNTGDYGINYIKTPKKPNWTYVINPTNQSALYNPNAENQQDFELHISEEPKLVIKILQLAGVNMKDYNLAQLAGQKEASVKQQEKQ